MPFPSLTEEQQAQIVFWVSKHIWDPPNVVFNLLILYLISFVLVLVHDLNSGALSLRSGSKNLFSYLGKATGALLALYVATSMTQGAQVFKWFKWVQQGIAGVLYGFAGGSVLFYLAKLNWLPRRAYRLYEKKFLKQLDKFENEDDQNPTGGDSAQEPAADQPAEEEILHP